MGIGGPAREPTQLKILKGNPSKEGFLAERAAMEPQATGTPEPPTHLDAASKREFRKVAKQLADMGIAGRVDSIALSLFAENYAIMITAIGHLQEEGVIIISPNSYPVANPWLSIKRKAEMVVYKLLGDFGMTPSARSKLSVQKPKAADELGEFLSEQVG